MSVRPTVNPDLTADLLTSFTLAEPQHLLVVEEGREVLVVGLVVDENLDAFPVAFDLTTGTYGVVNRHRRLELVDEAA